MVRREACSKAQLASMMASRRLCERVESDDPKPQGRGGAALPACSDVELEGGASPLCLGSKKKRCGYGTGRAVTRRTHPRQAA